MCVSYHLEHNQQKVRTQWLLFQYSVHSLFKSPHQTEKHNTDTGHGLIVVVTLT